MVVTASYRRHRSGAEDKGGLFFSFIGIILGAVQYCISMGTGFDGFLVHLTNHTVGEGDDAKAYGLIHCLSDPWNVGILVFWWY